jgi:hypothetical protein
MPADRVQDWLDRQRAKASARRPAEELAG